MNKHRVDTGLDVLVHEKFLRLKGKRVAILANQASVDRNFNHIVTEALKNELNVVKLFRTRAWF